jgi:predicted  nucleic acid-binding Zn-ribbon protein
MEGGLGLAQTTAEAEVRSERWRQEADAAVKRVASLEANVAALQEAITEAEAIAEQRRQEAKVAAKRADDLLAELFEMTCEHVEMSRWIAGRPRGATKFSSV